MSHKQISASPYPMILVAVKAIRHALALIADDESTAKSSSEVLGTSRDN